MAESTSHDELIELLEKAAEIAKRRNFEVIRNCLELAIHLAKLKQDKS